jgi:hypothetical protein
MTEFTNLIATVEQVRSERYPSLPADLVARILAIEAQHPGNRAAAMRDIKQVVLHALEEAPGTTPREAADA